MVEFQSNYKENALKLFFNKNILKCIFLEKKFQIRKLYDNFILSVLLFWKQKVNGQLKRKPSGFQ